MNAPIRLRQHQWQAGRLAVIASSVAATLTGVAATLTASCNGRATANTSTAATAEVTSREFESCSSSAACADGLRCFDQVCKRTTRSVVGDYYAALGARAVARGDADSAIAAYTEALSRYDADKIPLPPEIDCGYGTALSQNQTRKEQTELAARVLHRCILGVPTGSSLRNKALMDLTALADAGLEPASLAKTQAADLYLTRAAVVATPTVAVTVTAQPEPKAKGFAAVLDTLNSETTKQALLTCWGPYRSATKRDSLTIELGAKARYVEPQYIEDPPLFPITLDGGPGAGASAEVVADACVRTAVEAACKRVSGLKEAFVTKFVISFR